MLRYEYKFLENKERLMTLRKVEVKDQKSELVNSFLICYKNLKLYFSKLFIGHIRK
jgi:hypothetical protein